MNFNILEFILCERRKPRVLKGGGAGVFGNILDQRAAGFQHADASAQIPGEAQRHKRGPLLLKLRNAPQPLNKQTGIRRRQLKPLGNRVAGDLQQQILMLFFHIWIIKLSAQKSSAPTVIC